MQKGPELMDPLVLRRPQMAEKYRRPAMTTNQTVIETIVTGKR
jgi:hypothetical protein